MTLTLTAIDDSQSANNADGTKTIRYTGSFTNPYTAGGEVITLSSIFKQKFLGGRVEMVHQDVAVGDAGMLASAVIRGNVTTTPTTCKVQLFNSAVVLNGRFVDNTVADISNYSCTFALTGY